MYRYASTMGERYCYPIYFETIKRALIHKDMCDKMLKGLPGHDSMRIEELVNDEWVEWPSNT